MTESDRRDPDAEAPGTPVSRLSAAVLRISASLDLDTVLREVVESARALTGARLGVIATVDEGGLAQGHVASGLASEEARQMAARPDAMRLFAHLRALDGPLRLAEQGRTHRARRRRDVGDEGDRRQPGRGCVLRHRRRACTRRDGGHRGVREVRAPQPPRARRAKSPDRRARRDRRVESTVVQAGEGAPRRRQRIAGRSRPGARPSSRRPRPSRANRRRVEFAEPRHVCGRDNQSTYKRSVPHTTILVQTPFWSSGCVHDHHVVHSRRSISRLRGSGRVRIPPPC